MSDILTQAPTEWAKNYAEVHGDYMEKLARYGTALSAQGQAEVKKAEKENITTAFASTADAFTKVKAWKQSREKAKRKDIDAYKKKLDLDPTTQLYEDDINEYLTLQYNIKKKKAGSQVALEKWINNLRQSKDPDKAELAHILSKESARQLIARQEVMASYKLVDISTYDQMHASLINKEGGLERINEFDNSKEKQEALFRQWQLEELDYLQLSDEFKSAILQPELNRQGRTAKNINRAQVTTQISKEVDQQFRNDVETLRHNPVLLGSYLNEQITTEVNTGGYKEIIRADGSIYTVTQQAKDTILRRVSAIGLDSGLTQSQLNAIIDYSVDHPAAKTLGKAYFSEDDLNLLVGSVNIGQSRAEDIQIASDQSNYIKALALKRAGKVEEADVLMRGIINRNYLSDKQYTAYEKINVAAQAKDVEVSEDDKYTKLFLNGKLPPKAEIELIENDTVREKFLEIEKKISTFKTDNSYAFDLDTTQGEVYKARTNKTYKPGDTSLNTNDNHVVQKINNFKEQRLAYYINEELRTGETIPNIATLISDDTDAWKERNGWGTTNGPGMFSIQTAGAKKGEIQDGTWYNIRTVDTDYTRGYNHNKPSPNRSREYINKVNSFGNISKQERWQRPQGIFSNRQMLGFKENGYPSQDMLYIAAREGLDVEDAINKAVKYMDPDFAKLHNFQLLVGEAKPTQILGGNLASMLKAGGGPRNLAIQTMLSKLRWQGFDTFTKNDKLQLYSILATIEKNNPEITEEGDDDRKIDERKEQRVSNYENFR